MGDAIVGNILSTLQALVTTCGSRTARRRTPQARPAPAEIGPGPLSPEVVLDTIAATAPSDAIYVNESTSTVDFLWRRNGTYGALRWFAEVLKVGDVPGMDVPGIDFPSLAKGYGVEGVRAAAADDLKEALTAALRSQAPTLIEVPTLAEDSDGVRRAIAALGFDISYGVSPQGARTDIFTLSGLAGKSDEAAGVHCINSWSCRVPEAAGPAA